MLRKAFSLFEKVPKNYLNQLLIQITDLYFQMLNHFSKDQIITVKKRNIQDKDDNIPESEFYDMERRFKMKEKQFNYLSELATFLDFSLI